MNKRKFRYQGHFGVVFNVTSFTVAPSDRPVLRQVFFCEPGSQCYKVSDLIVETYDRMLADQRPCDIVVAISNPLTREQADLFNQQRIKISAVAAGAVSLAAKPGGIYGAPAGPAVSAFVYSRLEARHAGDVIVAVDAKVVGGIGPQHTSTSLLIKVGGGSQ
ncbi:hypothetical protein SAMN05216593_1254 [Pseudomonas asturiensis]|uniref:Uncharacterized protein n=1 Tax=Pseudomonas asturiensis TaxID=1190415 RepID=A0A1M7QFH4_9PSED|nr:hypothetical protein [Pseudomonas asturiensis]SHN29690.1 hypothetical protein SAMN05216593_1254 [Pseudomonas asturiensis]